jgi:hypothetical protein
MKKKILLLVIILTIITSMIVFKPLPVKAWDVTILSSPNYIRIIDGDIAFKTSTSDYGQSSFNNGNGLTFEMSIYDSNNSLLIYKKLSYPANTWTSFRYFGLSANPSTLDWSGDVGIDTSDYQKLQLGKTYTFVLSIKGLAGDCAIINNVFTVVNTANFDVMYVGYFTYTQDYYPIPLYEKDVSLTFLNYDCTTHIANFNVDVQGYQTIDFAMVSTSKMGKNYVISYVYDKTTKLLKIYFSSDLPNGTVTVSLGITCDNAYSLLKDISFTNTCVTPQKIQPGKFYITSPPMETKYDSPQVGGDYYTVTFNFAYGGNVINDFGSNWKIQDRLFMNVVTPPAVDGGIVCDNILITATDIIVAFHNDVNVYDVTNNSIWTYDSANNVSYLTVTIPIVKNYQPGMKADITFQFTLSGNNLSIDSENSVHIIIGEALTTTGNPLLDLIYKIWNEFKDWFINTMKFLFVPNSSDISQQLETGWIDIKNTQLLPNVSSSRYLTVTMPKALFGDNNTVQLDFGKMTEWNGWSNVKTITRGLIWLVFLYILIGMVT